MKWKTSREQEVEVTPMAVGDKDTFLAVKAVQRAYAKLAVADENSEEADDTEWALREKLVELCKHIEVKSEHVALADAIAILSVLQTGELPETDPTIPPTSETSETT